MSKQTAVEWLSENYLPLKRGVELGHEHTVKVVNQAKEIEKQQMIKFANDYLFHDDTDLTAEQYYNETYNK